MGGGGRGGLSARTLAILNVGNDCLEAVNVVAVVVAVVVVVIVGVASSDLLVERGEPEGGGSSNGGAHGSVDCSGVRVCDRSPA